MQINSCDDCPFLQYDSDYGRSYDSGYDCKKAGKRIIDDWEYNNRNNPKAMIVLDEDAVIPIPEFCPLQNEDESNCSHENTSLRNVKCNCCNDCGDIIEIDV